MLKPHRVGRTTAAGRGPTASVLLADWTGAVIKAYVGRIGPTAEIPAVKSMTLTSADDTAGRRVAPSAAFRRNSGGRRPAGPRFDSEDGLKFLEDADGSLNRLRHDPSRGYSFACFVLESAAGYGAPEGVAVAVQLAAQAAALQMLDYCRRCTYS
jgi:hypothetical protein